MGFPFEVARSPAEMRALAEEQRRDGRRVCVVPTMGYLHEGHVSLLRCALEAPLMGEAVGGGQSGEPVVPPQWRALAAFDGEQVGSLPDAQRPPAGRA